MARQAGKKAVKYTEAAARSHADADAEQAAGMGDRGDWGRRRGSRGRGVFPRSESVVMQFEPGERGTISPAQGTLEPSVTLEFVALCEAMRSKRVEVVSLPSPIGKNASM